MWPSQACMQIYPYIKHCSNDKDLSKLILSIFNRMLKYILLDPFANAFVLKNTVVSPFIGDVTFKKQQKINLYIVWVEKYGNGNFV